MKLEIYNARKGEPIGNVLVDDRLVFSASHPIIIQPAEIMKVQTDLVLNLPAGHVLNISTAPELSLRAGELFPGLIVIGSRDKFVSLELPVRNCGRNPLSIMPKQPVAVGYVYAVEVPQIEEITPPIENAENLSPNVPQKKNPGIKFEIR